MAHFEPVMLYALSSMSSMADGRLSKRKRIAYMALSITGGAVLGFIVLEGGLSAILVLRDPAPPP
jgi:hypothetical protein